ncbi:hypothetical protein CO608_07020 [Lysobacteraceae bacterium NML08-0793]|nr:hypothetical protein CO608_07020 [Xanthomonadaceae bacterium NML08-0793]
MMPLPDKTKIVAWLVALSVNAVFVLQLARPDRARPLPIASPQRVQLYFISPIKPAPPVAPLPNTAQAPSTPQSKPQLKPPPRPQVSTAALDTEKSAPAANPASDMVDDGFAGATKQTPGQSTPGENFAPDPLRRRPAPMTATTERLRLDFRDSSLGGRLRSISQAGICKELRAQLASQPASASVILASLSRHGCLKD